MLCLCCVKFRGLCCTFGNSQMQHLLGGGLKFRGLCCTFGNDQMQHLLGGYVVCVVFVLCKI